MNEQILIAYGHEPSDVAILLLAAADELGYEPYVVRNQPEDQGFRVTRDVAVKAGLAEPESVPEVPSQKTAAKKPTKKAAAKKTAAKKSASKG